MDLREGRQAGWVAVLNRVACGLILARIDLGWVVVLTSQQKFPRPAIHVQDSAPTLSAPLTQCYAQILTRIHLTAILRRLRRYVALQSRPSLQHAHQVRYGQEPKNTNIYA